MLLLLLLLLLERVPMRTRQLLAHTVVDEPLCMIPYDQ
jgi:hypothetical protein